MKRFLGFALVLVLAAGFSFAQKPAAKNARKAEPEFQPATVVFAADARYPVNSIAWGSVVLEVTVGPGGETEEVRVVRGVPSLTEEALRSVKQWKFGAAQLDGKPLRSTIPVTFVFTPPPVTQP